MKKVFYISLVFGAGLLISLGTAFAFSYHDNLTNLQTGSLDRAPLLLLAHGGGGGGGGCGGGDAGGGQGSGGMGDGGSSSGHSGLGGGQGYGDRTQAHDRTSQQDRDRSREGVHHVN